MEYHIYYITHQGDERGREYQRVCIELCIDRRYGLLHNDLRHCLQLRTPHNEGVARKSGDVGFGRVISFNIV